MSAVTVKVIVVSNYMKAVIRSVSAENLTHVCLAGGHVVEAYAKINANAVFSGKALAGGGLTGSIQTVLSKSDEHSAEVDVGPTVIYGRIHELGGIIRPVFAKMLHWKGENGEDIFAKIVHMPARPYLRPALDEHEKEVLEAMEYQLTYKVLDALGGP